MNGKNNLIPFQSEDEAREAGKKGGKKSGEVRRAKKTMRESMKLLLSLDLPENESREKLKELGIEDNDLNIQTAILTQQVIRAAKGDLDSAKFCRDTSGEFIGAEEEVEEEIQNYTVRIPAYDVAPSFLILNRFITNYEYNEFMCRGGRGSVKSSDISEIIIELLENNPNYCALIIRRREKDLKDSVFTQMKWAIDKLGETYHDLPSKYKSTTSPIHIRNLETDQRIYFRGTEDVGSIKSIKPPKDKVIAIVWYEEYDQIQGLETVRKIEQSLGRGSDRFYKFKTFNTPRTRRHFANIEFHEKKKGKYCHESDYRSVYKEWLGQPFLDDAEHLEKVNYTAFENEYLGKEVSDGGNVFENLEIREITDEEINMFDSIYNGNDWGWYPDPNHFGRMNYDSATRTLSIFYELRCNKTSNLKYSELLEEFMDELITSDNGGEQQKSNADMREFGFNWQGAVKGPGSVEAGIKWLQSLNKIIIDPVRCPYTSQEYSLYEYEKDKDGNVITGFPDKDNHSIDMTRYALERVWKRKGQ